LEVSDDGCAGNLGRFGGGSHRDNHGVDLNRAVCREAVARCRRVYEAVVMRERCDNRRGVIHAAKKFVREKRSTKNVGATRVVEQSLALALDNSIALRVQYRSEFLTHCGYARDLTR
jgi:hypothetical protein